MKTRTSIQVNLRILFGIFVAVFALANASQLSAQLVDIATNASDPSNLADTEPSIAVNPLNPREIVVVTFSEGWGPAAPAPIWRSTDGGATWAKLFILPQPNAASGGPGDQKASFDSNGRLHVAELVSGLAPPRCLIFRQTGAAGTNLAFGALYGDDQPHLDVDHSAMSAFLGRLYSPWLDFSQANARSTVMRSPDRGVTVTNVGAGDNGSFPNRTSRIALDPDGRAFLIFKTREGGLAGGFETAHFLVRRSDNGGVTWNALGAAGVSVHGAAAVQTWFTTAWGSAGKVARARSSDAWIAADPGDGDIYAVFCDQDASGFGQIFVSRSTNHGASWSAPVRVTDGTHHSAFPEIAVAANGAVGVLYIDFAPSGASTLYRHRFARSFNNGATWSTQNLQSMDPGPMANASSGFLWGDYEGLTAQGNAFFGVFTGQSIGRTTTQLDPIFFTRSATQLTFCEKFPWFCVPPVRLDRNLVVLECLIPGCRVIDPLPRNCLVKWNCPGCPPNGLCPPWYNIFFDDIDPAWKVTLVDPLGKPVRAQPVKNGPGYVLSFRPEKQWFEDGKIGDYSLVFEMGRDGKVGQEYQVKTRLETGDKPYKP